MWFMLACFAVAAWLFYEVVHKRKPYPPGPTPLPLIGNLHQVGFEFKDWPPLLNKWGEEYGGIYTLWLPQPKVIVTKYSIHREAFTGANGDKTAARPISFMISTMFSGMFGLFLPEGYFWREQRRFTMHVLRDFGFARTGIMEEKILYDVDRMVQHLEKNGRDENNNYLQINMDTPIGTCLASIINDLVSGKRYDFDDEYFQKFFLLNRQMFELFSDTAVFIGDSYPFLAKTPVLKPFLQRSKVVMDQFYEFFMKGIQEHKTELRANPGMEAHDLVAAYIKEMDRRQEKGEPLDTFSEYQLYATIFDLWSAGMETSTVSLRWMFLMMCKHPDIQDRVHRELKTVLGDRQCTIKDQLQLPLVRSVITETWRYISFLPINVDRRAVEEVTIAGYVIPKDTVINMHVDSVLKDPEFFPNPEIFNPDRFVNEDGMGKRQCVGEGLARMNILLIFTAIMQRYKLSLPKDLNKDPEEEPVYYFTKMPSEHQTILQRI